MTTAIDAVQTRPSNTPSAQRPSDDSRDSFAQLFAPLALISGPTSPAAPLASATNGQALTAQKADAAKPAKEKSARSSAQDLTSDAAASVSAAASQRLFEGRGAEKPNEVNIAGRAAAELASHGEPVVSDQPAPDTASRSASRQTTKPDNAAPDPTPSRAAATADSPRPELATAPIGANAAGASSAAAATRAPSTASASQAAPVQGLSPTAPRQTTAAAAASSATAPASAVSSAARSTGADAQNNRHDNSAAAARTRMWARLERLGQRPPAPANAAGTRSTDRAAGPDSTIQAQFARGLAAALKQRDGHVTLRLNPETLGNIRVDLSVQADRITASIAAADEQARRLLSADVVALRTALEATGLNVEHIEVVEAPAEPSPRFPTQIASHTPTSYAGTGGFDDPSRQPNNRDDGKSQGQLASGHAAGSDSSGLALDSAGPPSQDLTESSDLYVLRIDLIA